MVSTISEISSGSGVTLIYNKNTYYLPLKDELREYRTGEILCELFRMDPSLIKEIVMQCDFLDDKFSIKSAFAAMQDFKGFSKIYYPSPIIQQILFCEFSNVITIWMDAVTYEVKEDFVNQFNSYGTEEFRKSVFDGTGYTSPGGETMLQLMLSAYLYFVHSFEFLKKTFIEFCEIRASGRDIEDNPVISAFFDELIEMQRIDYRIVRIDGQLMPTYSCNSLVSLFIFDISNCIKDHTILVKCQNCGNFFVPAGRSDAKYCQYPLTRSSVITCRDVGAKNTRSRKEKNDVLTRAYRNTYLSLKMALRRHPDDPEYQKRLTYLQRENKNMLGMIKYGSITEEDYLKWLMKIKKGE